MKSNAVLCAMLAASLLTSPFAMAQGDSPLPRKYQDQRGNSNDRDNNAYRREDRKEDRREDRRDNRRDERRYESREDARQHNRQDNRDHGNGNDWGQGYAYGQYYKYDNRGAGPNHSYYRGDRLPYEYRTRQYVVEDWRGHRLSAPPQGYQWVQNGGDYILVAIATGVILNLLFSN